MISVIIPAYNTKKYIKEAIESVVNQTYNDWELIIVDDGSTDDTGNICDLYADNDSRIRVIHRENGGVSRARNYGLDIAKGKYIVFLDSDDILPLDALERMIVIAKDTDADIVCGCYEMFKDGYFKRNRFSFNGNKIRTFSAINAIKDTLYQKTLDNSPWGKIYKKNVWENIRFSPNLRYEDLDIFYRVFLNANRIVHTNRIIYYYRMNEDSYIHTFSESRFDVLIVTQKIVEFCKRDLPMVLTAAYSRQISANFNIIGLASRSYDCNSNIISMCWRKIAELRRMVLLDPSSPSKNKCAILISYLIGKRFMTKLLKYFYRVK